MNKRAIVILYSGSAREPGCNVIESLASIIVQAGLSVPELIEIKSFDSDSISKAILSKSLTIKECRQVNEENKLLKQSVIYMSEKYKDIPETKRGIVIFRDAIRARQCIDDDARDFNRAINVIISNQEEAKHLGMGKRFIDMLICTKEKISDLEHVLAP